MVLPYNVPLTPTPCTPSLLQELLDNIFLDAGPPLLALAHLGPGPSHQAARLADLLALRCNARELLTLLLETLDACSRR